MGKFHQISTELCPLIYIKISFPGSIFCKLCIIVHIRKEWFGIEDGVNFVKYVQSFGP